MSLMAAIELISNELPQQVRSDIEAKFLDNEEETDFSVRDFSIGRSLGLEHLKFVLERKVVKIEGDRTNPAVRKFNQLRLNFINKAMTDANPVELWSGYCMVKVRYLLFLKKRKRLWFEINVSAREILKLYHPIPAFGREVFWK